MTSRLSDHGDRLWDVLSLAVVVIALVIFVWCVVTERSAQRSIAETNRKIQALRMANGWR